MEHAAHKARMDWVPASRRPGWPAWALLIVAGWAAINAVAFYVARAVGSTVPACFFKLVTGVSCPTCGLSRGADRMLHGEILAGWSFNPLLFTLLFGAAALLAVRFATGRRLALRLSARERRLALFALLGLVALNWAYLLIAGI